MALPILVVTLNLAAFLLFFLYFRKRIDKSYNSEELIRQARLEINQIMLELNQATERNISLIEDRLGVLKEQLDRADKSVVQFGREFEKQQGRTGSYTHLKPKIVPVIPNGPNQDRAKGTRERVLELHKQDVPAGAIAKMLNITVAEAEFIISLGDKTV